MSRDFNLVKFSRVKLNIWSFEVDLRSENRIPKFMSVWPFQTLLLLAVSKLRYGVYETKNRVAKQCTEHRISFRSHSLEFHKTTFSYGNGFYLVP
ncbi:uncharacterized protein Gasu_66160 [Galdieria sulphuraria]|uniref:Uncharacterized protein n=1 Tax=Galdieria sulphuraria TaxID=130081 RepID=M2XQK0_GALSU|nr:uncharacterized protein Gasu_66160 [Galdieria sulphuraria]EME25724.1 hypothetical protein Gasu_66160 [Galdieria sulphuraria]|eukprot:XP_005702244.1 hypothetical protein Gasu_66160 [Galdieria sulphuraria]